MILRPFNLSDPWALPQPLVDGVEVLVAVVEEQPAVMFVVIHAALLEVHTEVRPGFGRYYAQALSLLCHWLSESLPNERRLWTFVQSERMERVAQRYGFRSICQSKEGEIYMYLPLGGKN